MLRLGRGVLVGMLVLVGLGLGLAHPATPTGYLVVLTGATLQPKAVTVAPGATVVWLNRTRDRPLSLTFDGSPSPDLTCPSGLGFVRRNSQIFTLPALPPGGTVSLCFPAAGTYGYVVHGLDHPVSGTITVGSSP